MQYLTCKSQENIHFVVTESIQIAGFLIIRKSFLTVREKWNSFLIPIDGIYFFNFGWRDMTATSTDVVLKILKQMSFSLTNGNKVAVHCHAGRGRTGLIIAAWLIFHEHMSAKDAIKLLRQRRKDSISKKSQEKLLYQFEKEIKESRQIFFFFPRHGLNEYLFHQKKLYALSINSAERYVTKLVLVVLERLEMLTKYDVCRSEDVNICL